LNLTQGLATGSMVSQELGGRYKGGYIPPPPPPPAPEERRSGGASSYGIRAVVSVEDDIVPIIDFGVLPEELKAKLRAKTIQTGADGVTTIDLRGLRGYRSGLDVAPGESLTVDVYGESAKLKELKRLNQFQRTQLTRLRRRQLGSRPAPGVHGVKLKSGMYALTTSGAGSRGLSLTSVALVGVGILVGAGLVWLWLGRSRQN